MLKKTKQLSLIVLIAILGGCAVFEGGKVPKTTFETYDLQGIQQPTLSYKSLAKGGISSVEELPEAAQNLIEGELLEVLEESQYFSRLSSDDETADIKIDVTMTNTGSSAAMIPAFITGLSLYTIPSWATDNFDVIATVESKNGQKKEYTLSDSTTLVQWLPMIFVYPMKGLDVIPEVRKNMYRNLLSKIKADGFLDTGVNVITLNK